MTTEDLLTRTFTEVTETTDYPFTPVEVVAARAARSRRRRRRTTALVAAAALVVAGGSAATWLRGGSTPAPSHPAPLGSLPDIPMGGPAKVGLVSGDTYLTPSGQRLTSSLLHGALEVVDDGDGALLASAQTAHTTLWRLAAGGTTRVGCGSQGFALGGTSPAYWVSLGCGPHDAGRLVDGSTSISTAQGMSYDLAGRVGDGIAANAAPAFLGEGSGSSTTVGQDVGPVVVSADGTVSPITGLTIVTDATPRDDLALGVNGYDRSRVVSAATGAVRWQAKTWSLSRFSPSGAYVSGYQEVGRQTSPGVGDVVAAWDAATGRQVVRVVLPGMVLRSTPVWEDDSSMLVVAQDLDREETVLRVNVDGDVTRAARVLPRTLVHRLGYRLAGADELTPSN